MSICTVFGSLDGNPYFVQGVNADLLRWAGDARHGGRLLRLDEKQWQMLVWALSTDEERRQIHSIDIMRSFWEREAWLGPFPRLNRLLEAQYNREFYSNYRDHVAHQLKVYLLGLLLYDQCPLVKASLQREIRTTPDFAKATDDEAEKEFLRRWLVAALGHDSSYLFEVETSPWYAHREEIFHDLSEDMEAPVSASRVLPGFTREMELQIGSAPGYSRVRALDNLLSYAGRELLQDLDPSALAAGLGEAVPGQPILRRYFDLASTCGTRADAPANGERECFFDHGVVAAAMLLRTWKCFRAQVEFLANHTTPSALLASHQAPLRKLKTELGAREATLLAAAAAIALHNINTRLFDDRDVVAKNLRPDNIKLSLTSPSPTALAFLLGLADTLQCWDRQRYRAPTRRDLAEKLQGYNLTLRIETGQVFVFIPSDHRGCSRHFEGILKASRGYLDESDLNALLRPDDGSDDSLRLCPRIFDWTECRVLRALSDAGDPLTTDQLAASSGISRENLEPVLDRFAESQIVKQQIGYVYFNEQSACRRAYR